MHKRTWEKANTKIWDEMCSDCKWYSKKGYCTHRMSTDKCADRDGDATCDNDSFEGKK